MNTETQDANASAPTANSTPPPYAILLVDDGNSTRLLTKWFLSNFGYTVHAVRSAEEALMVFDPGIHDLVITDNSMPGLSGLEMAHIIKLRSSKTPVLMYSSSIPQHRSCLDAFIQRPTHLLKVKETVERLLIRGA